MRPTLRSTAALSLAATIAIGALGVAPASADLDDVIPPVPGPQQLLTFSVDDTQVVEGDPGDGHVLTFEVTASHVSDVDVTMRARTGEDAIIGLPPEATPGDDFTPIDEMVTIPAGSTSTTVDVPVIGDTNSEGLQVMFFWLDDPSTGLIIDDVALGFIIDDDIATPTIHISQETHAEGTGGTTDFEFTVSLSHAFDQVVSVDVWTAPGSATTPADFSASPETIVFAPGKTEQTYVVTVVADRVDEGDEEFVVQMQNAVNGTIVGGGGLGTILDDDGELAAPGGYTTAPEPGRR